MTKAPDDMKAPIRNADRPLVERRAAIFTAAAR
jgi:hypothetical protein